MAYSHATLARPHPMRDRASDDTTALTISQGIHEAISWIDEDGRPQGPDHVAIRAVPLRGSGGRRDAGDRAIEAREDAQRMQIRAEVEDYAIRLLRRHLVKLGMATAILAASPAMATEPHAYVGAFGGIAVFDTTVSVGGIKVVDQGGDAPIAGARAGIGWRLASGLYLGAEAEAFAGSGRSRLVIPAERSASGATEVYSRSLDGGGGAFLRIGIAPGPATENAPPSLFFARAGGQAFSTSMGTEVVPAVGIGAEVRITRHLAARIDATYGWNDMETWQATAGLQWRF